jgi:hypothetical protein
MANSRRTHLIGGAVTACALGIGLLFAPSAGADPSPCANWFMAADLRCSFYEDLDAEGQAAVAATAADLAAIPSEPAPPTEAEGGSPPDFPPDDPQPPPVTGILDDIGAPEPPAIFQAVNNYTGYLPDGREARVWSGASGSDPTLGEVMTLILSSDSDNVISRKLVTAPSNDGPLVITTTVDSSTLLLAAADGRTFRYEIDGDHIVPGP